MFGFIKKWLKKNKENVDQDDLIVRNTNLDNVKEKYGQTKT